MGKIDSDDEMDLPSQRINLAKNNIGCEIVLNASGSRDATAAATYLKKVWSENIPRKFQQKTYKKQSSCIWLSAFLLIHSVDPDIGNNIVKFSKEAQETYEWLDFFIKK